MTTKTAPDYYAVLGVSPKASMEQLKAAYRRRAMECHPDRGGSHEKMLMVIEAWEILSDPVKRGHYDKARIHPEDIGIQHVAREEAREAQTKADTYPRDWIDFEYWQEDILNDFCSAKYTVVLARFSGWPRWLGWIPVVSVSDDCRSLTGLLFMLSAALLAVFLFIPPIINLFSTTLPKWLYMMIWGFAAQPVFLFGLSAGAILHAVVRIVILTFYTPVVSRRPYRDTQSKNKCRILPCLKCGQKLRFAAGRPIRITCPKCGFQSVHNA